MPSQSETAIRQEIQRNAEKRVRARLGFFWHLAVFIVTNVAMMVLNLLYSPMILWFLWPLFGWGLGLGAHAFFTFQMAGDRQALVEAEVQRELARRGLK